jgi:hypothetical protein
MVGIEISKDTDYGEQFFLTCTHLKRFKQYMGAYFFSSPSFSLLLSAGERSSPKPAGMGKSIKKKTMKVPLAKRKPALFVAHLCSHHSHHRRFHHHHHHQHIH